MSAPSPQPLSRGGERGYFGEGAVGLCGIASQLLGWRPDDFWNCTPEELMLALRAPIVADAPDKDLIDALRARFPDDKKA